MWDETCFCYEDMEMRQQGGAGSLGVGEQVQNCSFLIECRILLKNWLFANALLWSRNFFPNKIYFQTCNGFRKYVYQAVTLRKLTSFYVVLDYGLLIRTVFNQSLFLKRIICHTYSIFKLTVR